MLSTKKFMPYVYLKKFFHKEIIIIIILFLFLVVQLAILFIKNCYSFQFFEKNNK